MRVIRKVMAVVFDIDKNGIKYLILHRTLRWHGWELLKETMEGNETTLETIKRGVKEETGIGEFEIVDKLEHSFEWIWGDYRVKVEEVYLVRVNSKHKISLKQQVVEHDTYLWTDKQTALDKLTHDNTRKVLEIADNLLRKG